MNMIQELHLKSSTVQSVHFILYQMFESAVMDNIIRVNLSSNVMKSLRKLSDLRIKRNAMRLRLKNKNTLLIMYTREAIHENGLHCLRYLRHRNENR